MKNRIMTLCLSGIALIASYASAQAEGTLQDSLKSNAELSSFYSALSETGVLAELNETLDYMVFAPINSQFDAAIKDRARCLALAECKQALTNILRNHIVGKVVSLKDTMQYKAGIFGINGHFIPLTYVGAGRYTIEGQNVLDIHKLDNGSVLYIIDGLVATKYELSLITAYQQAGVETDSQQSSTTQKTTIPDPACGAEGCPDKKTTITTIKKTVTEVTP
jgi:uncharacterized surface protein with fasciclin (FAS1) repeats